MYKKLLIEYLLPTRRQAVDLSSVLFLMFFVTAANADDGTVKIVEFTRSTSKGDFIGCQLLLKLVAADDVYNKGQLVVLTVNFSSYYYPDKAFNFKMKVCGWDIVPPFNSDIDSKKFDVPYAYLTTGETSWAKKENESFAVDKCFNSLFWDLNGLQFYDNYFVKPKIAFSRMGGGMDVLIPITFSSEIKKQALQSYVDMDQCMDELMDKVIKNYK